MKILEIYPTSRIIRLKREELKKQNGFLPTLMRIDEFEQRVILIPDLTMVDSLQRIIFLQEASRFKSFHKLKINRELIKFFTKSDSILKFFEELSHEGVTFEDLVQADAYVEFEEHIEVLKELFENYREILKSKGLTDRAFLPYEYEINSEFINTYDKFELFLEGYMSRFELSIIEKIAEEKEFIIHMQTSKFNKKVQDRFLEIGVEELPQDSFVSFSLHTKKIINSLKNTKEINSKVFYTEERLSQIPIMIESIQEMVNGGIEPKNIIVVLPDEKFKNSVKLYDSFKNFNFSMGFDYNKTKTYKQLEAIYQYWQSHSDKSILLLKQYEVDIEKLNEISPKKEVRIDDFFSSLDFIDLDFSQEAVENRYLYFKAIFSSYYISRKEWLFLWLKQLKSLTIDDIRGGKITVMGALETRGVSFDGVIVLDFNDGIVPAIPAKDNFLNSSIRKFANLPTKSDRESLQKQLYKRLLEEAKKSVIIYSLSNNKSPTSYLYELGLNKGEPKEPNLALLYSQPSQLINPIEPIIKNFDATKIEWSSTRLNIFLSCKRKYYYIYHQKLEPKKSDEINEGAFLHRLLEHLFKKYNSFFDYNEMRLEIDKLLDELLKTTSAKIAYTKLLWKEKLKKFIKNQIIHFKGGWRVIEREKQIKGEIGGIKFRGIIDRIDQDNTHTLILDYKSGSIENVNKVKGLDKLSDFQMSIYYELLKNEYKNIKLAFVGLFSGEIIEVKELKKKNKLLYEHIAQIKTLDTVICEKCEDVSKCKYCDYTLLCERGEYL